MKENQSDPAGLWDEARHLAETGKYDGAIEIYTGIIERYGDDDTAVEFANAYIGDMYLTLKQFDLSETHIMKAIALNPARADYHYILGFVYSKTHRWEKAEKEFEAAIRQEPENGEFLRGLGWVRFERGDKAQGIELLRKANAVMPGNPNILADLAVAYMAQDIYRARVFAEEAFAADPDHPVAGKVLSKIRYIMRDMVTPDGVIRRDETDGAPMSGDAIYRFKVSLKDNPDIWRLIDIKGTQRLSTLHKAIFKAFNRYDEHAYSFFLKNVPWDREHEYTSPGMDEEGDTKLASRIRIDSVELYGGTRFLYLFDFGDEWWHDVELVSVTNKYTRAVFPKIVKKNGKSPPQYPKKI
ncbi:MAG: tetratricopeptide repeat protein [Dehalococcoidales bacterium]|nr:tetratricopeptide repeat protein [Dehalococcoidales bacterium]